MAILPPSLALKGTQPMSRILQTVVSIACIGLIALTSQVRAQVLSVTETSTPKAYAPQGTKVDMIYFKLRATGADTTFSSVQFRNNSSRVYLGKSVKKVYLFKDTGTQGTFEDGSENQLAVQDYGTIPNVSNQKFSFSDVITSGNSQGYFLVYELDSEAELGATTNITLLDINDSGYDFGSNDINNDITITGLIGKDIISVAPAVVLPGQTYVPMLKLSLRMSGEDLNEAVTFNIENQAANFVTGIDQTNGVTNAFLFEDTNNIGFFDPTFLSSYRLAKQISAGSFLSSSNVAFNFPNRRDLTISTLATANFFVVYDIGGSIPVSSNTRINAQVRSITGLGSESGLTVSLPNAAPITPASANVAGLSYESSQIKSIAPSGQLFGNNSIIPMMVFELRANQVDINLSTINIQNPGTVPFITTSSDPKNVQKIKLYLDTNRDGEFNGESAGLDTLIADYQLGNGNQVDRAVIPVRSTGGGPVVINKFDSDANEIGGYNSNNAVRIFSLYTIGQTFTATQAGVSGSVGAYVVTRLENAVGTVNVSGNLYTVQLSGTKPVASTPEALARLQFLGINVLGSQSLNPTSVIQGQVKVPMLYLDLYANAAYSSTNVQIGNEYGTFSPANQGVSKVWVYRDNGDRVLGESDVLLGTIDNPSNVASASIRSVPFQTGRNRLLVLYDIGANANAPSIGNGNFASAQLGSITSTDGLTLGGQTLPFPNPAPTIQLQSKRIVVSGLSLSSSTPASTLKNFTVAMTLQNTSTGDVIILDAEPRFYFSVISGSDISYEFTSNTSTPFPLTIPAEGTENITFDVSHSTQSSDGIVLIDPWVQYVVSDSTYPISETTGVAEVVRYNNGTGYSAAYSAGTSPRVTVAKSAISYPGTFPAYVSSVSILYNGTEYRFADQDAIPKQSAMIVRFTNAGANLDENSFVVQLNGVPLTKASSDFANTYSYDASTGTLTVPDIGFSSGALTLQTKDLQGNQLNTFSANFSILDKVRLSNANFYPNPYLPKSNQPLILGFSITQPAKVRVYLYNYLGSQVWQYETTYSNIGYQTVTIPYNSDFIRSGMYLCKIYAEDNNGNRSNAVTKLAIY